ncbi:CopM family metallochaperone [Methylorubrum extorquens]
MSKLIPAVLAACMLAGTALAQDPHHHHGQAQPDPKAAAKDSAATKAYRAADARMHREMDIRYTNDVDLDFVRGMIPHHRGAIEMAKIALEHSKDPEIRKLAEDIVKAQDTEIAQMEAFIKRKQATDRR